MRRIAEKTGRTFIVAVFLVVLLLAGASRVSAAGQTLNETMNITGAGQSLSKTFDKATYTGNICNLTIRNASAQRLKLNISMYVYRATVSTAGNSILDAFAWGESSMRNSVSDYVILEANASATMKIEFRRGNDYTGECWIKIMSEQAAVGENGGKSFYQPQAMTLDGTESGILLPYASSQANARYFSITTVNRRYLNLEVLSESTAKTVRVWMYKKSDTSMLEPLICVVSRGTAQRGQIFLEPGAYVLKAAFTDASKGVSSYTLKLGGRDYIPATGVVIKCSAGNPSVDAGITRSAKTFTFAVSTVPANSDDKLSDIITGGNLGSSMVSVSGSLYGSNSGSFSVTYSARADEYQAGYNVFSVKSTNGIISNEIEVWANPDKPKIGSYIISYDRVHFYPGGFQTQYSAKNPVRVYVKSGNRWSLKATVTNTKGYSIKKLKANKKYQFKFAGVIKRTDGSWIEGPAVYKTLKTGKKTKASVKSVKVSNVKVTSKYKWEKNGVGWEWKKYYTTTFRVTVTLKKKLPGALGLSIAGKQIKGKGTKFTCTISLPGNRRRSNCSVMIKPYYQKGTAGAYGPAVKKKIRIR